MAEPHPITRRTFLGGLGLAGIAGEAAAARAWLPSDSGIAHAQDHQPGTPMPMTHNMVEGDVDPATNGFDPTAMLTDFDYGKVSTLAGGQTLREYTIVASEKLIEIAPGITFPAWVYSWWACRRYCDYVCDGIAGRVTHVACCQAMVPPPRHSS
jgi:hypothetical protein